MRPNLDRAASRRGEAGQASLVALLVGVALIGVLVWVFLFRNGGKESRTEKESRTAIVESDKKTIPGAALDQAKGVECSSALGQLRQAIQMERISADETGGMPPKLTSLSGIPDSMTVCPASGRPYAYNPQAGTVQCVTPGHEQL